MKTKSLALGAALAVALLVAAESVVVLDHAGRVAAAGSRRAIAHLVQTGAQHFAQHVVRALVGAAKP